MSRTSRAVGAYGSIYHVPTSVPLINPTSVPLIKREKWSPERPLLPLDHGWSDLDCDRSTTERSEAGHQRRQVGDAGQQMGVPFGAERRRVLAAGEHAHDRGDPGITARL